MKLIVTGSLINWQEPQYNIQHISKYSVLLNNEVVAEVSPETLSYQFSDLPPQSVYNAKVVTLNTFGKASDGAVKRVATVYPNPADVVVTERSTLVRLNWSVLSPKAGVSRYNIYVSDTEFSDVFGMAPTSVAPGGYGRKTVSGLVNDKTYYIAVTTLNIGGFEDPIVQPIAVTPSEDTIAPIIVGVSLMERH